MKNKKAIIEEIGGSFLTPLTYIGLVFLCMIGASPFIMIWGSFILGLKYLLSGVVGLFIIHFLMKSVREQIGRNVDAVEEELKETENPIRPKSEFMNKLEKAMKDSEAKRSKFAEKYNEIKNK